MHTPLRQRDPSTPPLDADLQCRPSLNADPMDADPLNPVNRQTGVTTLPCPKRKSKLRMNNYKFYQKFPEPFMAVASLLSSLELRQ